MPQRSIIFAATFHREPRRAFDKLSAAKVLWEYGMIKGRIAFRREGFIRKAPPMSIDRIAVDALVILFILIFDLINIFHRPNPRHAEL